MTVDQQIFARAMQTKDPRFDGRFFIGVRTTGVYCRPVCPVKSPRLSNVEFFPTAAAAAEAGFRPCLRCRPESSPGTPAWAGTSTTVSRGLRLINEGALDHGSVAALSERLGVTTRHLSRLFMQHLGASPNAIAQTRRLHFAKKLLDETSLSMTEIALSSGYGSVRRFNDHFVGTYGRPPSQLRRHKSASGSAFEIRLPYRPPYAFSDVVEFLGRRATPGVESVAHGRYERTIVVDDEAGSFSVEHVPSRRQLLCRIHLSGSRSLMSVVERIRRMFDLNADPLEIQCCLSSDAALAKIVARNPGKRVPGCWDPFEIAVRAIVGQQISVKGATTVMGKIARMYGDIADGRLVFPTPQSLARIEPDDLPMPRARASAIRDMAAAVASREIDLDTHDVSGLVERLVAIKGIGPWTAQYVAMRASNDPDAFLHGDLVLLDVAGRLLGVDSPAALLERSQTWRPWRAYAGVHLWSMADDIRSEAQ